MKKYYSIGIIITALLLLGAVLSLNKKKEVKPIAELPKQNFHYSLDSNKEFYGNLETAKPDLPVANKIYGGIVSHHTYVATEIAKFFSGLKNQKIKTVVLVGPNHFGNGAKVLVSSYPYQTPWGIIEPNLDIINQLKNEDLARSEEQVFETEHSISALVGSIKYALPDAKLVPIIVNRNLSQAESFKLAEKLNQILPEDSLILASADFSHHVDNQVALKQDKISVVLLKSFDYGKIQKLDSKALDSPPTINILLKYLEIKGALKMEYKNLNSAIFSGNLDSKDVTSYVFAYFSK